MGNIVGNRSLQGSPTFPYADYQALSGSDVFLDLAFMDHTMAPVTPTSIKVEIDDITNAVSMLGPVTLAAGGSLVPPIYYPAFTSPMYLQISGSTMQMTYPYQGSQLVQVKVLFTATDTVSGQAFTGVSTTVIELGAAPTVSGSF